MGVVLGLGLIWALSGFEHPAPARREFSVEGWKSAPELHRYWMAKDYLRTRDVKSMSLEDVVGDLGSPRFAGQWCSYGFFDDPLDPALSEPMGTEYELIVRFAPNLRVSYLSYNARFDERSHQAFETDAWRARGRTGRLAMVRDLDVSRRCIGLTMTELTALLGPPDHRFAQPWIKYVVANSLADYQYLEFRADETGKVIWAQVYDG